MAERWAICPRTPIVRRAMTCPWQLRVYVCRVRFDVLLLGFINGQSGLLLTRRRRRFRAAAQSAPMCSRIQWHMRAIALGDMPCSAFALSSTPRPKFRITALLPRVAARVASAAVSARSCSSLAICAASSSALRTSRILRNPSRVTCFREFHILFFPLDRRKA